MNEICVEGCIHRSQQVSLNRFNTKEFKAYVLSI